MNQMVGRVASKTYDGSDGSHLSFGRNEGGGDNKGAEKVPDTAVQTRSLLLRIVIGGRVNMMEQTRSGLIQQCTFLPTFAAFNEYVYIQRSEKWLVRGWVKFVPALA